MQSIRNLLREFCLKLNGTVEEMPFRDEFGCHVDPMKIVKNMDEFTKIVQQMRERPEVARAYLGSNEAYFYVFPEEGIVGFQVTETFAPQSDEVLDKLYYTIRGEFYNYMAEHGLHPEFHFIPRVDVGLEDEAESYVDVAAEVIYPDLDLLSDVAKTMLKFKRKLEKLVEKYE